MVVAHKLTNRGLATRRRIIEGAAQECRSRGAHLTTLDHVMARTRTSKSQLFHYFPNGKEQLFLEVAAYEARRVLDDQQPHLSNLKTWAAWQCWRDAVVERYRSRGPLCPMAGMMAVVGRSTPGAQAISTNLFREWRASIVAGIHAMQEAGEIAESVDAERAGAALLAGIQGGVGILMSAGDLSYLEAALDEGIEALRRAQ
ncbi:TetR/AcrR family transcriptional regulator [Mycobacterium sp. 236(2023)]|uniref:TetR/AcrR family transcriptional regulator n=1 Tax=Mycobacterium sp. 236(2023) TaxID=3038163 RepID=UPI002415801B|nr:TetR/AcrR family transcriptional regulator [Mycobacterium sp. 236(2023)]MDG4665603.1 TetR/AcrR family transcriptional regulator [Mycobacterium sp. 236(2023)]